MTTKTEEAVNTVKGGAALGIILLICSVWWPMLCGVIACITLIMLGTMIGKLENDTPTPTQPSKTNPETSYGESHSKNGEVQNSREEPSTRQPSTTQPTAASPRESAPQSPEKFTAPVDVYTYTLAPGLGGYVIERGAEFVGVLSGNKPSPDLAIADYVKRHQCNPVKVVANEVDPKSRSKNKVYEVTYKV